MRLKARELARQLDELETWVAGIRRDLPTIVYMANTNCDDGIAGVNYDKTGGATGPSDPVGNKASTGQRDIVGNAARDFLGALNNSLRELRRAGKAGWSLLPLPEDQARALTEQDEINDQGLIQGTCKNPHCGRTVARTANDRLRSGLCENCYRYWKTHGVDRPKLLCDAENNIVEAFGLDEERLMTTEGAA